MIIEQKAVNKGVFVHTKLSPQIVKQIAKIAKENKATKAAVINEILKKALK